MTSRFKSMTYLIVFYFALSSVFLHVGHLRASPDAPVELHSNVLAQMVFSEFIFENRFALDKLADFADKLPSSFNYYRPISVEELSHAMYLAEIVFSYSPVDVLTSASYDDRYNAEDVITKKHFEQISRAIANALILSGDKIGLHKQRERVLEILFATENFSRIADAPIILLEEIYKADPRRFSNLMTRAIESRGVAQSFVDSVGLLQLSLSHFRDFHLYFEEFRTVVQYEIAQLESYPAVKTLKDNEITAGNLIGEIPKYIYNIPGRRKDMKPAIKILKEWKAAIKALRPIEEQTRYTHVVISIDKAIAALSRKPRLITQTFISDSVNKTNALKGKFIRVISGPRCKDLFN